jgi:hypothetical protein
MRPTMRPLALLALAAASAACAHAPAAPPAAAASVADYFPLAVGRSWTWEDQSPGLPAAQRGARRTVRILERTADGYFRDSERGELRRAGGCVEDKLRRLLCGPLEVGTAWTSVVSVSSTERYQIVAVGEVVSVPAGRFTGCVRVRAHNRAGKGTELVNEMTYAPGVGPVRIETYVIVDGAVTPQLRAELASYQVEGR